MKCSYCGQENAEGDMFCSNCGMKLGEAKVSAVPPTAPPAPPTAPTAPPPAPAPPAPPETPSEQVRCSNCGMMNPEGASVCASCNQPLGKVTPAPGVCPHCGFDKNPPTAKFCMNCGVQLAEPPPPKPPPVMVPAKLVLPNTREIALDEPEVIIGRGDFLKDISPEEAKYLSREHLTITCENGMYYITDEKSTNGTKLNGIEITGQGRKELHDNDELILADTITVTFKCSN